MNGYAKFIGMVLAATVMALLGGEGIRYATGSTVPASAADVRRNFETIKENCDTDKKEHREFYLAQAHQRQEINNMKEMNVEVNKRLKAIEEKQQEQAIQDARRESKLDARLEAIEKQNGDILEAIQNAR